MNFVSSPIGGRYLRVVDWHWSDPLDATPGSGAPTRPAAVPQLVPAAVSGF